ncbi:MAG: 2-nitropropane dioxygenase, partial [Bacteroidota bacterium]
MIQYIHPAEPTLFWKGSPRAISFVAEGIREKLNNTEAPCYVVRDFGGRIGVANEGLVSSEGKGLQLLAMVAAAPPEQFGDKSFREDYRLKYAYKTGAMANGIASAELVIAMGKAGLIGSFGAAGLVPTKVEAAIQRIQAALPTEAYAANLIHSPAEPALEIGAVDRFIQNGVRVVEASAYLRLTPHIVYYRAAGLAKDTEGNIIRNNKVIAKISRREVAGHFMKPAPEKMLAQLVSEGKITTQQAELAKQVPVADDITVEADSGGHTDNRPMVALLPSIIALRDEIQAQYNYQQPIRVGAAGG